MGKLSHSDSSGQEMPKTLGRCNTRTDMPRGHGEQSGLHPHRHVLAPAGLGRADLRNGGVSLAVCVGWVGTPFCPAHLRLPGTCLTSAQPPLMPALQGSGQAGAEMAATQAEEGGPELICH